MIPQNAHCAGMATYGGDNPIPRMNFDAPFVPLGWQVARFGKLGRIQRCFALTEVDLSSQVDMLHSVVQ